MVFSSNLFLFVFLPAVLAGYFIVPKRLRNTLLLASSVFFYAWGEIRLVWVLLLSISMNYIAGLVIGQSGTADLGDPTRNRHTRAQFVTLVVTIAANLGLLCFFKYFAFAVNSWNAVVTGLRLELLRIHDAADVTLPLGISFFTFQAMSYSIDLYRGHIRPARSFISFATYVSLFPQLVAGPIVRYAQVAEELVKRTVTIESFSEGIRRFVFGLGKKVIIANTVAWPADQLFALPADQISAPLAWFAVFCYTLQIYFDFSGYSDMAIGLGRMFGFHFPENFNHPYTALSIRDFWRRWHISLSTWFRDYVYVPMGGNRKGATRTCINLLAVFFLCGLWHGASWTFVAWGLFHGCFLILERTQAGLLIERLWSPLRRSYTLAIVFFGWLLFRAESFEQATTFLSAMFGLSDTIRSAPAIQSYWSNELLLAIVAGVIGSTPWMRSVGTWTAARAAAATDRRRAMLETSGELAESALILGILFYSTVLLGAQTHNPFIYFRF